MSDIHFHTALPIKTLRAQGVEAPMSYGVADRVRFGELDALAHVSNTAYLRWFENFRVGYLRDYGMSSYPSVDANRVVLRRVELDYLAEMKLNETYIVAGRTDAVGTTSCQMQYAVWSGNLRATSTAVLVFIGADGLKCPIPPKLRATMIERDEASDLTL